MICTQPHCRTCHSLQHYPVPFEKTIVLMVKRATCTLAGSTDCRTAASNWHIVPVYGSLEESHRQGKIEILGEKLVPVSFCQRRPPRSEIQWSYSEFSWGVPEKMINCSTQVTLDYILHKRHKQQQCDSTKAAVRVILSPLHYVDLTCRVKSLAACLHRSGF